MAEDDTPSVRRKAQEVARAERIKSILGMSRGAANNKLRKSLLFHLAGKLDLTNCYRCGVRIETVDEFSVEHTDSWEYSDDPIGNFFDVERIAFSHLKCNIAASEKTNKIYSTSQERSRANWAKFYSRHGDEWNKRRNARRRIASGKRKISKESGSSLFEM